MNVEEKKTQLNTASSLTFKSAAGYALLPGIIPRLRSLSRAVSGFLFVFIQIFGASGLIDRNHPCLRPENIGRYRFWEIVALAAQNVVFDKKHLPQTLMFFAVLGSIALSVLTALARLTLIIFNIPQAHAQFFSDSTDGGYQRESDGAYVFLGEVFGNTGLDYLWGGRGDDVDRHALLHPILKAMFQTYSLALLVIAVFMIIYLIFIMVADSARTGTPFGQNFNSVWAPLRLALAIGLLIPISNGYNGAQLIAFQVSEWGSALATNLWVSGMNAFSGNGSDPNKTNAATKLIAMSQPDDGYNFMRGVWMMALCKAAVNEVSEQGLTGNQLGSVITTVGDGNEKYINYQGMVVKGMNQPNPRILNADYCGQINVPEVIEPIRVSLAGARGGAGATDYVMLGALPRLITQRYDQAFQGLLLAAEPAAESFVEQLMRNKDVLMQDHVINTAALNTLHRTMLQRYRESLGYQCETRNGSTLCTYLRTADFQAAAAADGRELVRLLNSGKTYGWATAGSFMLTLVYANNVVSSAVNTPPVVVGMPRALSGSTVSLSKPNATVDEKNWVERWFGWGPDERAAAEQMNSTLVQGQLFFNEAP